MRYELMNMEMADEIAEKIGYRQATFDNEPLDTSIKVVMFGYGDSRRIAHCILGDWSGPKSDMNQSESGRPICPKCGRVATEDENGWGLALVHDEAILAAALTPGDTDER